MVQVQDRLALVELIDRDGRIGRTVDVHAWPVTVGRALDNLVVLDDPHVAAEHASIGPDGSGVMRLSVMPGVLNAAQVGARRVPAGQGLALPQGSQITLGGQRLRLRLRGDTLAAERALGAPANGRRLGMLVLLLALLVGAGHWVDLDPGADFTAWLPMVLGLPLMLAAWCGAWALASKLFQHRFDFWGHMGIALPWMLAIQVSAVLVPHAAAMLGWPWLWHASTPLQAVLAALLLRTHLAHVLPAHGRAVAVAMAAMVLVSGSIGLALNLRSHGRAFAAPYMATLPLPQLRLGATGTTADVVQAMEPLREPLARRVREAAADEAGAEEPEASAD